ncbi:MAG TPA: 3-phosphoshikimate 1-carboxyvinyltransferase [Prolixibacteraceae bacterium]|nr:3-phosphoshikimate 1-carboxyvinyltransferase [Prolixibacteraceae bacterium]
MQKIVHPSVIHGQVSAPASKSMMQRAIAAAILARGTTVLRNYTPCNDSDAAIRIAGDFGCRVAVDGSTVSIISNPDNENHPAGDGTSNRFNVFSNVINCGESGLGIRMFSAIAALSDNEIILHGEGSLKKRPVSMLEKPLRQLGVSIETTNGFVPIKIKGPLKGGNADIDGSLSSQMLTGLLLALPCARLDSVFKVTALASKPYIEMTLRLMNDFGVKAYHEDYKTFTVKGNQKYMPIDYSVEGDWSGAAFLLVAGALGGRVTVTNLDSGSLQADVAVLDALKASGAKVRIDDKSVSVEKSALNAFEFNATDSPDLFPPLVTLAAYCSGNSVISGVGRLKHKESDRASVLQKEFARIGTEIILDGDLMVVKGGSVRGGTMHANHDHRIAMAGAVAGIAAKQPVEVENAESVAKSYPGFYDDLASIGAKIE